MVRVGLNVRMLATVESNGVLMIGDRRGKILPASKAACGKALLAHTRQEIIERLYRSDGARLSGSYIGGIAEHLRALDQLEAFHDHEVLPGHGFRFRFRGLSTRIAAMRAHVRARTADAGRSVAVDPDSSIYEIAARMQWSRDLSEFEGLLLHSALAQTEMYVRILEGRAESGGNTRSRFHNQPLRGSTRRNDER